jgi:hypothetical protein
LYKLNSMNIKIWSFVRGGSVVGIILVPVLY